MTTYTVKGPLPRIEKLVNDFLEACSVQDISPVTAWGYTGRQINFDVTANELPILEECTKKLHLTLEPITKVVLNLFESGNIGATIDGKYVGMIFHDQLWALHKNGAEIQWDDDDKVLGEQEVTSIVCTCDAYELKISGHNYHRCPIREK